MDELGCTTFLKLNKKDAGVIQRYMSAVRHFETYLAGLGKLLNSATPDDIRNGPRGDFLALGMYYEYIGDERLSAAA